MRFQTPQILPAQSNYTSYSINPPPPTWTGLLKSWETMGGEGGSILGLVVRGGATATAREGTKACSGKERVRMSFFSHTFGVPSFRDERRGREENVTL